MVRYEKRERESKGKLRREIKKRKKVLGEERKRTVLERVVIVR